MFVQQFPHLLQDDMLTVFLTEGIQKILSAILFFLHIDGGFLQFLPELHELAVNALTGGGVGIDLDRGLDTWVS